MTSHSLRSHFERKAGQHHAEEDCLRAHGDEGGGGGDDDDDDDDDGDDDDRDDDDDDDFLHIICTRPRTQHKTFYSFLPTCTQTKPPSLSNSRPQFFPQPPPQPSSTTHTVPHPGHTAQLLPHQRAGRPGQLGHATCHRLHQPR